MEINNLVNPLLEKHKSDKISITFGRKSTDFLFEKNIDEEVWTLILNDLIQKYNFTQEKVKIYKSNNKYMCISNNKKETKKQITIDYTIDENFIVKLYNESEIQDIEFPCKKNYDKIIVNDVTNIKINSLSLQFIEENDFKYINAIIENNAYREDSIKNLNIIVELFLSNLKDDY